jgi:glycosyltransferase involved in cell wall biosynthesis
VTDIKVLKIVPNDFQNASRDKREVETVAEMGWETIILAKHTKGLLVTEKINCYLINRVQLKLFGKRNAFYFKAIRYIEFVIKVVYRGLKISPDIISGHDLPAVFAGYIIKKISRKKIVLLYDAHELTSEIASNVSLGKTGKNIKVLMEKLLIKRCDEVMVVNESISKYNHEKFGLKKKPVVVRNIPHAYNYSAKKNFFREEFGIPNDKVILLYQGLITKGRGLVNFIKALPKIDKKAVFVIMGYGNKGFLKEIIDESLESKIFFREAVPYEKLIEYTSSADIGIFTCENYCLSYYYCLPNKLFEYIQARIPIVCSDFPEMRKIIEDYSIGVLTDPGDIDKIANDVNLLLNNDKKIKEMQKNLKKASKELTWENEKEVLKKLYTKMRESLGERIE